ncbi:hypothetical protein [Armatimonas sp.]|uniref:hypothetical protein n=1 Tax=Armatimonas sp. TaxID=1872638 RepID=UPI00374CBA19
MRAKLRRVELPGVGFVVGSGRRDGLPAPRHQSCVETRVLRVREHPAPVEQRVLALGQLVGIPRTERVEVKKMAGKPCRPRRTHLDRKIGVRRGEIAVVAGKENVHTDSIAPQATKLKAFYAASGRFAEGGIGGV